MRLADIVANRLLLFALVLSAMLLAGAAFGYVSSVTWSRTFVFTVS